MFYYYWPFSFLILLGPLEKKNECWGQMGFEECLN